jgi:hypothetical protein
MSDQPAPIEETPDPDTPLVPDGDDRALAPADGESGVPPEPGAGLSAEAEEQDDDPGQERGDD